MKIRGSKHTFGDGVKSLKFNEFKEHCEGLRIFAQLPIKERNDKIKEAYGNLTGNVKQVSKPESGSDLHSDNVESNTGDIGAESGTNVGRENIRGKEDNAKVQKQTLRKPKKETKS
jgi:hypothetical protein